MERAKIEKSAMEIIKREIEQNGMGSIDLEVKDSLIAGGVIDSVSIISIVMSIQEIFCIVIQDHDLSLENFDTVEKIADFISRRLEED